VTVAVWLGVLGTVAVFYLRNPHAFGTTRLLLMVVAIDTCLNVIENANFGAGFGSLYGPDAIVDVVGHPILPILPELLNVVAGGVVLFILLLRWLPASIRERQAAEETADALRELATHDELTGLHNRRHFLALAETEWNRSRRYRRPLSLLMLDMDHFKAINDRHGRDFGDRVLVEIAQACRDHTRGADLIARIGGEEFAILLPETRLQDAGILAERLRRAVSELGLVHNGRIVKATISIGLGEASPVTDIARLMQEADLALSAAKEAGRNRVGRLDSAENTSAEIIA
jgi:diguanylate cyclase (GGDEF)-like protein